MRRQILELHLWVPRQNKRPFVRAVVHCLKFQGSFGNYVIGLVRAERGSISLEAIKNAFLFVYFETFFYNVLENFLGILKIVSDAAEDLVTNKERRYVAKFCDTTLKPNVSLNCSEKDNSVNGSLSTNLYGFMMISTHFANLAVWETIFLLYFWERK